MATPVDKTLLLRLFFAGHCSLFLLHSAQILKAWQNQYFGMALHRCWRQWTLDSGGYQFSDWSGEIKSHFTRGYQLDVRQKQRVRS